MPLPVTMLLFLTKSMFGETPAVKPTTSQNISSPVSSMITEITWPEASVFISLNWVLKRKSTWCSLICLLIISDS